MLGEPLACDVLPDGTQALEEGGRLAGIGIGVVGGDGLPDNGLSREADHQGKQGEHWQLLDESLVP